MIEPYHELLVLNSYFLDKELIRNQWTVDSCRSAKIFLQQCGTKSLSTNASIICGTQRSQNRHRLPIRLDIIISIVCMSHLTANAVPNEPHKPSHHSRKRSPPPQQQQVDPRKRSKYDSSDHYRTKVTSINHLLFT